MPTSKPRMMITFNDEELKEQVETFRFDNRYKSQNEALIALINRGFEALAGTYEEPPTLTEDELLLIQEYRVAPEPIKQAAHNILWPYLEQEEKSRA